MPNNYGGYNPIVPRAPILGVPQGMTSVTASVQPQCNVIYIDDLKSVLDHPSSPNEHLYFPEKNSNVIWVRETDGNGQIKNPIKKLTYTMEEVAFGPEANFVTKEEYQKLFNLVSSMNDQIENLVSQLK